MSITWHVLAHGWPGRLADWRTLHLHFVIPKQLNQRCMEGVHHLGFWVNQVNLFQWKPSTLMCYFRICVLWDYKLNMTEKQIFMTEAYFPHDWGQWGFLAKVNYCKKSSIYPVLTWNQFRLRPEMHQPYMVQSLPVWIHNRHDKIGISILLFAQSQRIFYVHQTTMMVDHCTQHEQNPLIYLICYYKQNLWKNGHKYILAQEPRYILHASSPYFDWLLY